MAKSIRSKSKQALRRLRREQSTEFIDKTFATRNRAIEAAMNGPNVAPESSSAGKAETMEVAKPKVKKAKKTAAGDAMDLDEGRAERVMSCLRPQGGGVSKKVKGKKGAKAALVFHVGKKTAQKKKAKRRAASGQ